MRESRCSTCSVRPGAARDVADPAPEQPSADDYIDFVTRILAASNELMLDKLKLVCSAVLRSFGACPD